MVEEHSLRDHLVRLMRGGHGHVTFDDAVKNFPSQVRGKKPEGLPYSAWMVLEHMRIAQWDILEFSRSADHVSPDWPGGYWPETEAPPDEAAWDNSIEAFQADARAMGELVMDVSVDLYAPIPHGDGQTILREALLVADHNSYHLGQIVLIRRLLNAW